MARSSKTSKSKVDLHFAPTHAPVGFTNPSLAQFDGSAEPVVRELLQNSLDAADKAGRPGKVQFFIRDMLRTEIPGWSFYEEKLNAAVKYRKQRDVEPTHDEKTVVSRMQAVCSKPRVKLLVCVDNGIGINSQRMDALLTAGNSDKGTGGAGSFGLGHHAAFGASDLRYVLYASRYRDKQGELKTIASGHAILATHHDGKQHIAADGYWMRIGQSALPFTDDVNQYPDQSPAALEPYLAGLEDTGTVVCIAGFNDFNRDEDDPDKSEMIARVAAANFVDAVHRKQFSVDVVDELDELHFDISSNQLEKLLKPISRQHRASKPGQIQGSQAYAATLTLCNGQGLQLPLSNDTEYEDDMNMVWFRELDSNESSTQIHLFRRGMWISSRVESLFKNDFQSQVPFDAVVSIRSGEIEKLVRNAEGPEHRGIDMRRLVDHSRSQDYRKRLRELLKAVAVALREAVPDRPDTEEYDPGEAFARVLGTFDPKPEPVPPLSNNPPAEPEPEDEDTTTPGGDKEGTGNGGDPQDHTGEVRPGRRMKYSSTPSASSGSKTVQFMLNYIDEVKPKSYLGLRVLSANGSDETCDRPLPASFLSMIKVQREPTSEESEGLVKTSDSGPVKEILIPAVPGTQNLIVELENAVLDPLGLELDLVRRKAPPDILLKIKDTSNQTKISKAQ